MLNRLENKLKLLNPDCTKDNEGGYTRFGFTIEEQVAMEVFKEIAKELGLTLTKDEIGNVSAIFEGSEQDLPPIAFGSHLDTVKNGGSYDGVVGVLAGLGVIKHLKETNYKPQHSIEIICFTSEESSRFGVSTIGSKAMTSLLNIENLNDLKDSNNIIFYDALKSLDLDLQRIKGINWKTKKLHSFVELHIEQGSSLNDSNKQIGIVKAIAGPLRYKVKFEGVASHTGTTLMNNRNDAFAAAARFTSFIEDMGFLLSEKAHFVATVTVADVSPNVMNVVPDTVELGVDIRSINIQLLEKCEMMIGGYCQSLANKTGVSIQMNQISKEKPIFMDTSIMDLLAEASDQIKMSHMQMASGAGHDAMNMAQRWPSGLLFIPCHGISHNPNEYTETINIQNGVKVLSSYVQLIDKRVKEDVYE